MKIIDHWPMMGFMSMLVKRILKMLLKSVMDLFCFMMSFPYELFVLVKRSPSDKSLHFYHKIVLYSILYII